MWKCVSVKHVWKCVTHSEATVVKERLKTDMGSALSNWPLQTLYYIIPNAVFLLSSQVRPHGTTPYCSDLLTDGGCVALLVVGFLLVTPLLVLALAAYCRLARHLQLGLCFIPYSRAVYKNLPASQHRGLGTGCCCGRDGADGKGKVWVWEIKERGEEDH